MPTRDLSNKRWMLRYGAGNAVTDIDSPTLEEIAATLLATPAVRFDGTDFGSQNSARTDDRSLEDDAGAQIRSFAEFGGNIAHFWPKIGDKSILRKVFDLLRGKNTEITIFERVGFKDNRAPVVAGDNINAYRVSTGSFTPDTEGDGGYAYIVNMLPKGDVAAWLVVPSSPASPLIASGGATDIALTVGKAALRGIKYIGNDITARATFTSDNPDVVTASRGGVFFGLAIGTAKVNVSYPGALEDLVFEVTVTA